MAHPHATSPTDRRDKAREMIARTGHEVPGHRSIHRYARGGGMSVEEDERQDERDIAAGVHKHESHLHKGEPKTKLKAGGTIEGHEGRHHLGRRARGGPAMPGKKGTHVNVIVAPQGGGGMRPAMPIAAPPRPMPPAPAPAVAPRPPMAAPAMAAPGGMGGAMNAGMPRPPGMMKSGGGVQKVAEAGVPWQRILHSKSGGRVKKRAAGGGDDYDGYGETEKRQRREDDSFNRGGRAHRDIGGPAMSAGMPAQTGQTGAQMSPQQLQMIRARMAQQGQAGGMMPAKRGGRAERLRGGKVPMEAGAGSAEGRLEKIKEYGVAPGRG